MIQYLTYFNLLLGFSVGEIIERANRNIGMFKPLQKEITLIWFIVLAIKKTILFACMNV